jgi:nitroreductase
MTLMDVIKSRRSVRRYKPEKVDRATIMELLEAARLAPSWGNTQSWRFIVVTDAETRRTLAGDRAWMLDAPVIVAVCGDTVNCGKKGDLQYFMLDAGIAMEHFILAAAERGLGTCWIGWFDEEKVNEALGCPEGVRCVAYTPVGVPFEEPHAVRNRRPPEEVFFRERYGRH